ncbi:MAG: LysR family transcriptional regulator, partial [Proteobacteria bacterium]|nr:LysR family transcriptional regulator [Pseudomonadota bacterium]
MSRRLPSLNGLKAFEAAARHLSFTRAAAELNVTQAAVSHQVKALEESLGLALFRRLNRALLLTDEGQALLPPLSEALDRMALAVDGLARREETGTLTVSTLDSVAAGWLVLPSAARADAFETYARTGYFTLPAGAGPFDILADGRIGTLVGADVYLEATVRGRDFTLLGALPGADLPSFGAAFLRVSPDGAQVAVGNNGGTSFGAAVERAVATNRFTIDDAARRWDSRQ